MPSNPNTLRTRRVKVTLRDESSFVIPAWILASGRPGPCLLVTAAQHGNEIQGAEVIRRFVSGEGKRLQRGSVIAVPMVNLPAIRERRPHIRMKPEQPYGDDRGHNMNRWWPGKAKGNDTARIPHALYRSFGAQATHVLDFHCWSKFSAAALLIRDIPGLRQLAGRLGHRFVTVCPPSNHTLGGHFCATGRVGITYEFSGQYVFDETEIRRGQRVLTNLAKAIGLLPGHLERGDRPVLFSNRCEKVSVTAPASGLFVADAPGLYQPVRKGARLGHILSDRTLTVREIHSPATGYIQGLGAAHKHCDVSLAAQHPYVQRGDGVATIAIPR